MVGRFRPLALAVPVALALTGAIPAAGQSAAVAAKSAAVSKEAAKSALKGYVAPRTPDGQPDLGGIWDSSSITPLERPRELGTKAYYSDGEIAAYEKQRSSDLNRDRRYTDGTQDLAGAYNDSWYDRGTHIGRNKRTSRVIDPPDGRFPPFTPEAGKKYDDFHKWFAANQANSAEDRNLFDRCIFFSQTGPPLVPGNYNNLYQIIQTPDSVTIYAEMPHQARTVPLTRRPALPRDVTQWEGDSVGHWEGETLVIESGNIRFNQFSHFGTQYDGMSDENMRVTERFTRAAPDLILYQATVVDPTVYTKPWTIELPMQKSPGPILEYACHEGNYGLRGILSGGRAKEKEAGK